MFEKLARLFSYFAPVEGREYYTEYKKRFTVVKIKIKGEVEIGSFRISGVWCQLKTSSHQLITPKRNVKFYQSTTSCCVEETGENKFVKFITAELLVFNRADIVRYNKWNTFSGLSYGSKAYILRSTSGKTDRIVYGPFPTFDKPPEIVLYKYFQDGKVKERKLKYVGKTNFDGKIKSQKSTNETVKLVPSAIEDKKFLELVTSEGHVYASKKNKDFEKELTQNLRFRLNPFGKPLFTLRCN